MASIQISSEVKMLAQPLKRQKVSRWKVVKSNTRYSCMVHGSSPYAIRYEAGKEVYALPETLGIMCFKSQRLAEMWMCSHYSIDYNNILIEVIPMGRGRIPSGIASPFKLKLYYEDRPQYIRGNHNILTPPKGTICYPAVYVVN